MFKIVLVALFLVLNLYSNEVYILPKQGEQIKDKISESITNAKSEILVAMYNLKTYLLINKALEELKDELFNSKNNFIKPFYIYGNEHDCESINIFVFE